MDRIKLETGCEIITFPTFRKWEGYQDYLIIAEVEQSTEGLFDAARRVYWVLNNGDEKKDHGGHYHPKGGKQEILVCLAGRAEVKLIDAKGNADEFSLTDPSKGLLVVSGVWHQITLFPGTVLLSIASTNYDPNEAISEYPAKTAR